MRVYTPIIQHTLKISPCDFRYRILIKFLQRSFRIIVVHTPMGRTMPSSGQANYDVHFQVKYMNHHEAHHIYDVAILR